jgi:nitrous oxide reductase accessory protein NosL
MRALASFIAVMLFASACSSTKPVPIKAGDVCFHCRQMIIDTKMATEVIGQTQHAFKFSSVGCLTEYLRDRPNENPRAIFVTDYPRGKMIAANGAKYVKFKVDQRTNAMDYAAFSETDDAQQFAAQHNSTVVPWGDVMKDNTVLHVH